MSVSKHFKQLLAFALVLTIASPAVQASASPSEQRAVCSKSRATVAPCTQTLTGTVGSAVTPTQRLVVSGIRENLSVALKGQSLPAGLRLNRQSGVISGTPTSAQVAKNFFLYVSSGRDDKRSSESGLVAVVNITVSESTPPPPTTYSITASAGANGTITPSGVGQVNSGGSATYTFTPATGYHVSSVSVDSTDLAGLDLANAIASGYTFSNVTANHTIAVSFAINTFTVTPSAGSHGVITPSAVETVNSGSASSTYTFTADPGYSVTSVSIDGTALTGPDLTTAISSGYTFNNVLTNHTIAVSFVINTYTITASVVGGHGTISKAGPNSYNSGSNSDNFTFTPDAGYHVSSVSVDNTDLVGADLSNAITNGYTFSNVTADHSISVSFAINGFTLTYDANYALSRTNSTSQTQSGSGSISLEANSYTAVNGAHFFGWNTAADGTGTAYQPGDSFTLSAPGTLYAIWYFNLTVTVSSLDISQNGPSTPSTFFGLVYLVSDPANRVQQAPIAVGNSVTYKVIPYSNLESLFTMSGNQTNYSLVIANISDPIANPNGVAQTYVVFPSELGAYFVLKNAVGDASVTVSTILG